MIRAVLRVLGGELLLQLRQPLTALMLVGLPILMGGGTAALGEAILKSGLVGTVSEGVEQRRSELEGEAREPRKKRPLEARRSRVHVPPEWEARLAGIEALELVEAERADAELIVGKVHPRVVHGVDFRGLQAGSALRGQVIRVLEDERTERLVEAGLPFPPDEIVTVEVVDHATDRDRSGASVGALLPGMLVFVLVIASLLTAIDVLTGEKERSTIETLLATGVDRRAVAIAKLAVITGAGLISGVVFLVALAVGQQVFGGAALGGTLGLRELLAMCGIVGLLAPQVAGAAAMLGIYASDYKAGSMLSAPVMLVVMAPSAAPMLPIELTPVLAAVPLANASLAAREVCGGSLEPAMGLLVFGFSTLHVAGAGWLVWRMLDDEAALLGAAALDSEGRAPRGRQALGVFALGFSALWFFGSPAQTLDIVWGMVFTQLLLAATALASLWWLGVPLGRTLSLRAPTLRDGALAAGAGLLAPAVGTFAYLVQDRVMPTPTSLVEAMSVLVQPDLPLVVPLLVFALLPALCEETLFRGAILGLMRVGSRPAVAILANAVLFGLLHVALHRWIPTGALGLLAAVAVWRSGSLWTGVMIHFANNAIAIAVQRQGLEPELGGASTAQLATAGLLAGLAFGGAFAMRGRDPIEGGSARG